MPELLELSQQAVGPPHGVKVSSDALSAPIPAFGHQRGAFEHRHMLLHGGKRHLVSIGEFTDGHVRIHDTSEDVAARGIGERTEEVVQLGSGGLSIYNQMVVYISR